MTLPNQSTKTNFDQDSDDPKLARVELADLVDKFNALLTHLNLSVVTSTPVTVGDGLETSGSALQVKLNGTTLTRSTSGLAANVGNAPNQILQLDGSGKYPAVDASQVTNLSAISPGTICMWGGAAAPSGYQLCDGTELNRTTFAALFSIIGIAYGNGNGTTTFNVPDFRGRAALGSGTGPGLTARSNGQTMGVETHVVTTSEMAAHSHGVGTVTTGDTGAHVHTINEGTAAGASGNALIGGNQTGFFKQTASAGDHTHGLTGSIANIGSGTAHQNMQPSLVMNFIIKT